NSRFLEETREISDEPPNSGDSRQGIRTCDKDGANATISPVFAPDFRFAHVSSPFAWPDFKGRAGTPATSAPGGTSRVTTDPAPTIAPRPTVTPGRTTQCTPMKAPRSIRVSATTSSPCPAYAFDSS